jgi:uncharacterized Zn-binding protein involved in type VI secretion
MPPAARIGDMHVCPMVTPGVPPIPHVGGPILPPGCPTVLIGGVPAARVGDMAMCVGPPDVIAKGSVTVLIGNMPAARIGDLTAHGGVIVLGCPTVMIGDAGSGGGGGGGGAGSGAGGEGGAGGAGATQNAAAPPPAVLAAYSSGQSAAVSAAPPSQAGPLQPKQSPQGKTWIGIVLTDFMGNPMPNQDFQVTLDSGQVLKGKTDAEGHARFDNVEPDSGNVAFTQLTEVKDQASRTEDGVNPEEPTFELPDYDSIPTPPAEEEPPTSAADASSGASIAPQESSSDDTAEVFKDEEDSS